MSNREIQAIQAMARKIEEVPGMAKNIMENEAEAASLVREFLPNTQVYRIVVGSLGLALLLSLVCAVYVLVATGGTEVPDILVATAAGALGALAGIVSQT